MNKDVKQLLREAKRQGFESEQFKRGHLVTNPRTGEHIQVYSDSTGRDLVPRFRSDLRSIGFKDPKQPPSRKEHDGQDPHNPDSPLVAEDTPPDTPEDPHVEPNPQAAAAIAEIQEDLPGSIWLIAGRFRDLAKGGPQMTKQVDGQDRAGRTWTGDVKESVIFALYPGLREATSPQMSESVKLLGDLIQKTGVQALNQAPSNRGTRWFVPDPVDTEQVAPSPEANPVAARDGAPHPAPKTEFRSEAAEVPASGPAAERWPCSERGCVYVGDSKFALNSHVNRSESAHDDNDPDAPFRCQDVLNKLTGGRETCVVETGKVDTLLNHIRRRHKEMCRGVQFCRTCLTPLPQGKAVMADHDARNHGDKGRRNSVNPPKPPAAAPASPTPKPPAPVPAPRPQVPAPTVPQQRQERHEAAPAAAEIVVGGDVDLDAATRAFLTVADQFRALREENAELRARQADPDVVADLKKQIDELTAQNAALRQEIEGFKQIRAGLAMLIGND